MARDDKPLRLKPVDDEKVEETRPVIRLGNREVRGRQAEVPTLRLEPMPTEAPEPEVSQRLNLPDKEELRTFQPSVDVLIEAETANPEQLEAGWGDKSEHKHPIPWGWFALIALAIAGAVVWSVFRVKEADSEVAQMRRESQHVLANEETADREASALVAKIESSIHAFFEARTPEARIPLCRQQERVAPLISAYYKTRPLFMGSVREIHSLQPLTIDNRGNFWAAGVRLSQGESKSVLVEIVESGDVQVDWESLVCYQPMAWDDFATQRPASVSLDFRVFVEPDSFHSHEFANSDTWTCFKLTALRSEETLFGYVRVGDPVEQRILAAIERNHGRKTALILRLMVPEDLKSRRGVVIENVVSDRWIHLDPPNSGS